MFPAVCQRFDVSLNFLFFLYFHFCSARSVYFVEGEDVGVASSFLILLFAFWGIS